MEEILYPEITLETDDIIMSISVKKDYSQIEDLDKRKEEQEDRTARKLMINGVDF